MNEDPLAIALVGAAALAAAAVLRRGKLRWIPFALLLGAVLLRGFGVEARLQASTEWYRSGGDAVAYHRAGLAIRESGAYRDALIAEDARWGTGFVRVATAATSSVVGEGRRAISLVFSLAAFAGLLAIVASFHSYGIPSIAFAATLWLTPSLWFWPAAIGKEALLLLALGLTTYGFAAADRRRWSVCAAGLALAFLVRPHVAAVAMAAMFVATLAAPDLRHRPEQRRELIGVGVATLATLAAAWIAMLAKGLPIALIGDRGGSVLDLARSFAAHTLHGGSRLASVPIESGRVDLAVINVLARPFPWEAHSLPLALAAFEVATFWALVTLRRREVWNALKNWREDRLRRFALAMIALYIPLIGAVMGNLGIIARQRTLVIPFLLIFLWRAPPAGRAEESAAPIS